MGMPHKLSSETIIAVLRLVEEHGTYRKAADACGISFATLYNVAHEKPVSRETESKVRMAIGLADLPHTVEVPVCKDCGGVHHGDCGGKQVEVRPVRHRGPVQRTRNRIALTLPDQEIAALRTIGEGNASAGVSRLLAER